MSRKLSDLSTRFRPLAVELIARCTEAQIPLMILDTLRTEAEQEENIKKGVSWTKNTKHLPQAPEMRAEAIDVVPYAMYQLNGPDKLQWDANDPVWEKIGKIGESLGMVWGGRWKKRDMGHFQGPWTKA
jgi:peptidoglycan L-alanyl-D-glutamate endopeptidase CwlK